jgi:hypothetical protein
MQSGGMVCYEARGLLSGLLLYLAGWQHPPFGLEYEM